MVRRVDQPAVLEYQRAEPVRPDPLWFRLLVLSGIGLGAGIIVFGIIDRIARL